MVLKPAVKVTVGKGHGTQGLPGATVRSTHTGTTRQIREADHWDFTFPNQQTKLYVERLHSGMPVTIKNLTTVPLRLTSKVGQDELDDVLGHNQTFSVPNGARVTVEA